MKAPAGDDIPPDLPAPIEPPGIPGYDPKTAPVIDLEQRSAELLFETKRKDAIACYEATCPPSFKEFRMDHPGVARNRRAVEQVLGWQYGPTGMLVAGETGLGKTRSVRALCRRLAYTDGVLVRGYHAHDFFSSLAAEVKYGRDDAAAWVDRKAWHPVVFIDDWGQEAVLTNREDWAQGWWLRFIDLRLERKLPVIITTNLSEEDVRGSQRSSIRGDPLLRRLREICNVVRFE